MVSVGSVGATLLPTPRAETLSEGLWPVVSVGYLSCKTPGQKVSDQWFPWEVWLRYCLSFTQNTRSWKVSDQWFPRKCGHFVTYLSRKALGQEVSDRWFPWKCGHFVAHPLCNVRRFLACGFRGSVATLLPTSHLNHSARKFLTRGF